MSSFLTSSALLRFTFKEGVLMKTFMTLFTLLSTLLFSQLALAEDVTFGAEFTFTSNTILNAARKKSGIVNIDEAVAAQKAFLAEVLKVCDGCHEVTLENSYGVETHKIIYPDGWYFVIATDPAVVEVQTKPTTAAELQNIRARIQSDIFDAAKKVGVVPHETVGGGHIHFDYTSSVEGNVLKLRNLLVDFANHPELAQGIWNNDQNNSPPIASLPGTRRQAFEEIIELVDHRKIRSVNTLIKEMSARVYDYNVKNWHPPQKYQAININRVGSKHFDISEQTIEVRSIRAQKSAAEFLAVVRVLEGRIELNKTRTQPLALDKAVLNPKHIENQSLTMKKHLDYVAESGVSPEEYIRDYRLSLPKNVNYVFLLPMLRPVTSFCHRLFH
jgi:hypothetical protein